LSLSPEDLLRLLLQDLGAIAKDEVRDGRLAGATRAELQQMLAALESNREKVLRILLAGQPAMAGGPALPRALDERLATRAR